MKDKLLRLFWGLVAGAVFVGGILGFGRAVNWVHAHDSLAGFSSLAFKGVLLVVICAVLFLIAKVFLYFNNQAARKEVEAVFPPDLWPFIYQAPLAKAVVERREDQIDGLRFLPQQTRLQCVNAPVHQGITPLHIAAALGRTKFCTRLLDYGADLQARDIHGQTPLDYATRFGQEKVCRLLQDAAQDALRKP